MSDLLISIFIFTGCLGVVIYLYLVWTFDYWKKRGVDGPKPKPLTGNLPNTVWHSRNMVYDVNKIYRQYKGKDRYCGIFMTRMPNLLILDPELIRDVLVKNFKNFHDNESASWIDKTVDPLMGQNPFILEGDEWKEKRAEITPALTSTRIKSVYPVMQEVSSKMTKYLERKATNFQLEEVDAKDLASRFTADVVSNCIYGIDAKAFEQNECIMVDMGKNIIEQTTGMILYLFAITAFPIFRKIYRRPFVSKKTQQFFVDIMNDAVKIRLENKVDRVDFLNYLLDLKERKNLSSLDMAAHTMTFFLDGFETSSMVISHCLYLLAQHKDVQERLRREIEDTILDEGNITYEKLNELPYLDQCLNETLRLFSPLLFGSKRCTSSCEITNMKDKKLQLQKGDIMMIPIYCLHYDEEYYTNPEVFDPDRFSPENGGVKKYKDMGVFLPFSDGPRMCLGMRFGVTQSKAAVVGILKDWHISLNPKTRSDYELDPSNFMGTLKGGVWLDFQRIRSG